MEIVVETNSICKPDPRLAFLARASARLTLVEAYEMEIGDAFDGLVDQCATAKEAASTTCDALLWELREYGLQRLKHSSTLQRLSQLSNKQLQDLIAALMRLQAKYPRTCSNQLLEKLRGTKWK
jgi:hypothetical protein